MTGRTELAFASASVIVSEAVAARRCRIDALAQCVPTLFAQPRDPGAVLASSYYQAQHDNLKPYQVNNWLVPYIPVVVAAQPRSVLEIGCGNGIATRQLAASIADVRALDWALSPMLVDLPPNVTFVQGDVRTQNLPPVDLVASADVLEHFPREELLPLVERLVGCARNGLHVIACYDDGHSHLSVARPAHWLALFQAVDPDYRFLDVMYRRGDAAHITCTITNF